MELPPLDCMKLCVLPSEQICCLSSSSALASACMRKVQCSGLFLQCPQRAHQQICKLNLRFHFCPILVLYIFMQDMYAAEDMDTSAYINMYTT